MLLLSHAHERLSVIIGPTHDISPGREHALDLAVLATDHLVAALRVDARGALA